MERRTRIKTRSTSILKSGTVDNRAFTVIMRMPWGYFKGIDIESIPSNYLQWLVENCQDMNLFPIIFAEWQFREDFNEHFWQQQY